MDLFPTWQIWQLIHEEIALTQRIVWQRMVGIKPNQNPTALLSNIWSWVIFIFAISVIASIAWRHLLLSSVAPITLQPTFGLISFALPLLILGISLRYGLRMINTAMKQYEGGTYESFALLPDGEFGNLLNIARVYRSPQQGKIIGVLTFGVLFAIVLFASFYSPQRLLNLSSFWRFDSEAANPASIMLHGFASFVSYLQSFVMATLLAMLILQRAQRREPRVWFIVGFIALQIALYFVAIWLGGYMGRYLRTSTYQVIGIEIVFATLSPFLISQTVVLTLLCELVNFALWQAVKRRLEA